MNKLTTLAYQVLKGRTNYGELIKEVIKEEIKNESYHCQNILENEEFIRTKQIMFAETYHTKHFEELITTFGYEYINGCFIELLEERNEINEQ